MSKSSDAQSDKMDSMQIPMINIRSTLSIFLNKLKQRHLIRKKDQLQRQSMTKMRYLLKEDSINLLLKGKRPIKKNPQKCYQAVNYLIFHYQLETSTDTLQKDQSQLHIFAKDMQSFDLLWFDLVTKCRHLVQELVGPLVDKVHQHRDQLNQLTSQGDKQGKTIENLNAAVFKKGPKMTMFEAINKQMFDLQKHTDNCLSELEEMKKRLQNQGEKFIEKLTSNQEEMLKEQETLRSKITDLDVIVHFKTSSLESLQNTSTELQKRISSAEITLEDLVKAKLNLSTNKCDLDLFTIETKTLKDYIRVLTEDLAKNLNHCQTLENYVEKYQNVRIQTQVSDTLNCVLGPRERKRLEVYDQEKMNLYYKNILEDNGFADVGRLVYQLNEKAKKELEEEERRQLNRMQLQTSAQSRPQSGKNEGSEKKSSKKKQKKKKNVAQEGEIEEIDEDEEEEGESADQSNKDFFPDFQKTNVDDNFECSLVDLVNAEFMIDANDMDFNLNQAQIIKVLKVFLYKMNLVNQNYYNHKKEVQNILQESYKAQQQQMKSAIEESNSFLQNVHVDFETYLKRHKKEHAELSQKFANILEIMRENTDSVTECKTAIEAYATMFACLLEFNNIEQALSIQDEADRQDISLMGHSKKLKGDSISVAQQNNTNIQPNMTQVSFKSTFRSRVSQGSAMPPQYQKVNASTVEDQVYLTQRDQKSILNLDPQCLTCSGQPSQVVQQFKIACLSYQPSKVQYRRELFNRITLMQMRQALLQKCEQLVNDLEWPFQAKSLKTKKVFNDLMQFFNSEKPILTKLEPQRDQSPSLLPYVEGGGNIIEPQVSTTPHKSPFIQGRSYKHLHHRQHSEVERSKKIINMKHQTVGVANQGFSVEGGLGPARHQSFKSHGGSALGKTRNTEQQQFRKESAGSQGKVREGAGTPFINFPRVNLQQ